MQPGHFCLRPIFIFMPPQHLLRMRVRTFVGVWGWISDYNTYSIKRSTTFSLFHVRECLKTAKLSPSWLFSLINQDIDIFLSISYKRSLGLKNRTETFHKTKQNIDTLISITLNFKSQTYICINGSDLITVFFVFYTLLNLLNYSLLSHYF
jgi:hypothetical protein